MTFKIEVKVPIDGSGEYKVFAEELEFMQKFALDFPKSRGEIIDCSLMVEQNVEQVIRRAKRDMRLVLIFDKHGDMIKEYSFKDKLDDFRSITKDSSFPIKQDFKQLRKDIHKVMSIRNKYAHGNMYYDGGLKKHFIQYEEDGKREAEISAEIIVEELKFISSVLNPIQEITNFFDSTYRKNNKLD